MLYETIGGEASTSAKEIVEIDLKMRLGDFHNLAELSVELLEKGNSDPIHAYNASVAYLFHNEFAKSRYYINLYKSRGYVDKSSLLFAGEVEKRLDKLENRVTVSSNNANCFRGSALKTLSKIKDINIPDSEPIIMDAIMLYICAS